MINAQSQQTLMFSKIMERIESGENSSRGKGQDIAPTVSLLLVSPISILNYGISEIFYRLRLTGEYDNVNHRNFTINKSFKT
jgi:hypothetical protein